MDLHGLTVQQAIAALRDEIDRCVAAGVAELLVVHGYGLHSKPGEGGALKTAVKQYLEELSDAGKIRSYISAIPKEGGEGATMVRVR
jgi:DNA-nicking Smr family endonuclease